MTTTQPHNPTTDDPFALIPGAYGYDYEQEAAVPAAPAPAYFVAEDGNGDVALWRGTGTDDNTCQPVAYRHALDAMDTVLWPTVVSALVEGGAGPSCTCGRALMKPGWHDKSCPIGASHDVLAEIAEVSTWDDAEGGVR